MRPNLMQKCIFSTQNRRLKPKFVRVCQKDLKKGKNSQNVLVSAKKTQKRAKNSLIHFLPFFDQIHFVEHAVEFVKHFMGFRGIRGTFRGISWNSWNISRDLVEFVEHFVGFRGIRGTFRGTFRGSRGKVCGISWNSWTYQKNRHNTKKIKFNYFKTLFFFPIFC